MISLPPAAIRVCHCDDLIQVWKVIELGDISVVFTECLHDSNEVALVKSGSRIGILDHWWRHVDAIKHDDLQVAFTDGTNSVYLYSFADASKFTAVAIKADDLYRKAGIRT